MLAVSTHCYNPSAEIDKFYIHYLGRFFYIDRRQQNTVTFILIFREMDVTDEMMAKRRMKKEDI